MTDVFFAMLPNVVLLDVAGPAEAFRIANRLVPGSYTLRYVGSTKTVDSAVGLQLAALQPLPKKLTEGSTIIVTGIAGTCVDAGQPAIAKLAEWLRQIMSRRVANAHVCCAGSVVAGHAGLLSGRDCTTHHDHIEELRGVEPKARVHANRIFVEDGRIFTSAGVTAGIDLALHLIGRQHGHRIAATVARELVVYLRRSAADPALSPWVLHRNHIHPIVHRVQDAVSRDPAGDWPAKRLADVAHTSSRNLARLFAQHAQCSPLDYVQRMRVGLARELLTQGQLSVDRVAEMSGFSSAHQFRRVWRRWESTSPGRL